MAGSSTCCITVTPKGVLPKAVASLPHLLVPNNQPWEPVKGKWLGRLGKAPEPVTWGFCLTAADRAGAALGNLQLADDFNKKKNMALSQYFLNFRSESTRYSFYQDTVFSSPELHVDEVFNTLPFIKGLVYKHLLPQQFWNFEAVLSSSPPWVPSQLHRDP